MLFLYVQWLSGGRRLLLVYKSNNQQQSWYVGSVAPPVNTPSSSVAAASVTTDLSARDSRGRATEEEQQKTRKVAEEVGVFTEETTVSDSARSHCVLTIRGIQPEVEEDETGSLITCKHGELLLLKWSMQSLWIS